MVKLAAESKIRKCQCCKTVMYIFFSFDQRETPEWFLAVAKNQFSTRVNFTGEGI
jgi:hypothetical protein